MIFKLSILLSIIFLSFGPKLSFALPSGVELKKVFTWNEAVKDCRTKKCRNKNKLVINYIKFNLKKLNPTVVSKTKREISKISFEGVSETGLEFLQRNDLDIAVNANFFYPCCEEKPEPKDLLGLVISEGKVISPPYEIKDEPCGKDCGKFSFIINLDKTMDILSALDLKDLSNIQTAVSGSHMLVNKSKVIKIEGAFSTERHPRTVIGIDKKSESLILVVFDGRQPGYSSGVTFEEASKWLIKLGAHKALNLDGGGSSIMAIKDQFGKAKAFNSPSSLRLNGNHLGFRFL